MASSSTACKQYSAMPKVTKLHTGDTLFGGGTEKSISTAYTKYVKFILFLEWECDYNNTVKKSKHRAAVRPDISIGGYYSWQIARS